MARLINEDELVKNRVDDYLDKSTSKFSKFLESTPNFVTYYQYDRVNSTLDKGLDNVEKHIGAHSPNRFNKIEKFPLYGMDLMSISQEFSEIGMDTNYESEAVILPGGIRPYAEDFFICEYIGDVYLFKINGVQNDTIRNKPFYKISYSLYKKVPKEEYVDEFVTEDYVSIFDNIGTNAEQIVTKKDYMTIQAIDKITEELIERYTRNFYRDKLNAITLYCPICKWHLYNRYLTKFIMDNELFKINKGFRTDYYLTDIADESACMFDNYRYTIYYALERKDPNVKIREFVEPYDYSSTMKINQFTHYTKNYMGVHFRERENENTIKIFPANFISNIKNKSRYTEAPDISNMTTKSLRLVHDIYGKPLLTNYGEKIYSTETNYLAADFDPYTYPSEPNNKNYIVENLIIEYLLDDLKITDETIDALNDIDFGFNIYCYSMVPLLIYVLKQYRKSLQETLR